MDKEKEDFFKRLDEKELKKKKPTSVYLTREQQRTLSFFKLKTGISLATIVRDAIDKEIVVFAQKYGLEDKRE